MKIVFQKTTLFYVSLEYSFGRQFSSVFHFKHHFAKSVAGIGRIQGRYSWPDYTRDINNPEAYYSLAGFRFLEFARMAVSIIDFLLYLCEREPFFLEGKYQC